jgi:hypothetical protein
MKKSLLVLLLLLPLALGLTACKSSQVEEVTPKDLYYDIERIQIDMKTSILRDIYDPQPFEELKAQIMEGKINRLECIFKIREILNNYKCVHLSLVPDDYNDLYGKIVPFHFYCFGNDYHVYYTLEKYKEYLGWKLVEIGGVNVEEVCNILAQTSVFPFETASGAKYCLENGISYLSLEAGGLIQKKGQISLTLENLHGIRKTVLCKPFTPTQKTKWYGLAPLKYNEFNVHNDRNTPFKIKTNPDKKTIYMQYNNCEDDYEYSLATWFSEMLAELQTGSYDTIVFDLRYNPGGEISSEISLNSLLFRNKEELNKYNLAIIITGRTYSCACMFLNDFIRNYPQVKIFGEETGQAVFNYTNINPNNYLKKLNCYFSFPMQLDEVPELYKRAQEVTHTDVHCGTFPDVPAGESFKDWLYGEDAIYNTIYDYFN